MSAITALSPECDRCGGPVKLVVRFRASGPGLYAKCTGDCGRAGWIVLRGDA